MEGELEMDIDRAFLYNVLRKDDVFTSSEEVLRKMKDIVYMLDRVIYTVAANNNDKTGNVLQSVFIYLRSIHGELSQASNNLSYVINCIDMPELPNLSGFSQKEKAGLRDVADVMSDTLPVIYSLINQLKYTGYSSIREIQILFNSVSNLCRELSV